jgi:hypothetical protein
MPSNLAISFNSKKSKAYWRLVLPNCTELSFVFTSVDNFPKLGKLERLDKKGFKTKIQFDQENDFFTQFYGLLS